MNIHRSAFAGRNFEYYSEDGILSGKLATAEVNGAVKHGVYAYIKHFALNDQETNRCSFLLTYASEQAIREAYLTAFEIPVKNFEGKGQAAMSSFNFIGTKASCANGNLLNNVLRDEWGFRGMVITDYNGSYGYMSTDSSIKNGNDLMLGFAGSESNQVTDTDSATTVKALRQASKNILYTVANSGYYADGNPEGGIDAMTKLFIKVDVAIAALVILGEVLVILNYRKKKKASAKTAKQLASNLEVEETNSYVKVSADRLTVTVGKQTGLIDYLDVDGEPVLKFRESIRPEFWRAPTDNDYGASMPLQMNVWRNPVMKLKAFEKIEKKDSVVLTATFVMEKVKAELQLRYCINGSGQLTLTEKMTTDKAAKVPELFRYGMVIDLPASFSKIEYYGRGPEECYVDRHSSAFIGKYEANVKDEYYPYVRPQESGNHFDIRFFSVFNPSTGKGLTFEGFAPIECSAVPYSVADLDSGDVKEHAWGQHSGDLVEKDLTQVHIQQRQCGLGCIDSWGAKPLETYRMPYADREFKFVMKAK